MEAWVVILICAAVFFLGGMGYGIYKGKDPEGPVDGPPEAGS